MLENYYSNGSFATDEKEQRLIAVQAALEIIKAAAGNDSVYQTTSYIQSDLEKVADAIQSALKKS